MTSTSLRLESAFLKKIHARLEADQEKSLNNFVTKYLERWLAGGGAPEANEQPKLSPASETQLAEILAGSVAELLQRDRSWAQQIIRTAQLRWPGGLLQERMAHYAQEKIFLGKQFSEWLIQRIKYWMDEHQKDVYLLVDAGSTNLWFCRYLWPHLAELSAVHRSTKLTILTNNVPVAEAFAEQHQHGTEQYRHGRFADKTKIDCELLGGQVESWYGALVGDITGKTLTTYTDHTARPGQYIALSAGNFVRLKPEPTPLIRGRGQKRVKELYIQRAHEVYIVAPLGKVFLAEKSEINKALHLQQNAGEHKKEAYEDVPIPNGKRPFIKLVTTLRESKDAILLQHSNAVKQTLGQRREIVDSPETEIQNMRHFCYVYDEHITGKTVAEQTKIELPHEITREPVFMNDFFGVLLS